ncbi:MAG: ABC transporter substrate-binding protein [Syntrophorhabdales bacterium]|jgi:branched-chain amino acid transport system substrate-binding protein
MGRKRFLTISLCIGLAIALAAGLAGTAQAADQAKTLRIGSLKALTGFDSFLDAPDSSDVKLLASMINEKGGITIKGQRYNIEIVDEDIKSTLEGTTAAATKLVFEKKVKFVTGPAGWFAPAASAVFNPNKVMYSIEWSTGQPSELGPYGFLGGCGSINNAIIALNAAKKEFPNVKKLAIMTADDGSAPYLTAAVKKLLPRYGFAMVGDVVAYSNELQDMSPIAAKLNGMKDADAIFSMATAPPHFANALKGLRELGNTKPWIACTIIEPKDLITIAGKMGATNVTTMANEPGAPGNPPLYEEIYKRRTGARQIYPVLGPSSLYALINVIKAADSIDPDAVKAQWEKMSTIETVFGKGMNGGDETYGIKHHVLAVPSSYQKAMNGEVAFRGWIEPGPIP